MTINILIVDDIESNIYALSNLINEIRVAPIKKINISRATSGAKALKLALDEPIDLIILDIQMPDMDGFEVAKFLKSNSKTRHIPIVFLTAVYKSQEFIDHGFEVGAIDYFTKPIEKSAFVNRLLLYIKVFIDNKSLQVEKDKANLLAEAKSEFLANVSHEIRTPLNAISGFISLIREDPKGDKVEEYAKIIDDSSKLLLQILEDVLNHSKIDSGKVDIERIAFNIKEEFDTLTQIFLQQCNAKNINLCLEYEELLPEAIKSDPLRIKQVVTNLLSNAIKFTPAQKCIALKIGYRNGWLNICVKDEGKGIAKEKLSLIFEPFSQEDTSTTREYGGTGLGLSICKNLVTLLGGELLVKSSPGEGSEFSFSIPVDIVERIEQNNTNAIDVKFADKKILLVEDNESNQEFMKVLFHKFDLQYDVVDNGSEAIQSYKKTSYDMILMDYNMPIMDGIEATKHILEYEKEHNKAHVPIIALTANALKDDKQKFLEAGMDGYIAKPVNKVKLQEVLENYLHQ